MRDVQYTRINERATNLSDRINFLLISSHGFKSLGFVVIDAVGVGHIFK